MVALWESPTLHKNEFEKERREKSVHKKFLKTETEEHKNAERERKIR